MSDIFGSGAPANTSAIAFDVNDFEKNSQPRAALAVGDYELILAGLEFKTSKAGNPMFVWTWIEPDTNTKLMQWTVTTSGKNFSFTQNLTALGVTPSQRPEVFEGGTLNLIPEELLGQRVLASIIHETVLNEAAQGKAEYERTPEDYSVFPRIKRVQAVSN